ncbi:helix-turn-helix protein [compost metagenome]
MGQLAEKTKLSRGYINNLEKGRRPPTEATLKRLSPVLQIPLEELQALAATVPPMKTTVSKTTREKGVVKFSHSTVKRNPWQPDHVDPFSDEYISILGDTGMERVPLDPLTHPLMMRAIEALLSIPPSMREVQVRHLEAVAEAITNLETSNHPPHSVSKQVMSPFKTIDERVEDE